MKRICIRITVLLTILVSVGWAQSAMTKATYYDTFNGPWLDPAKWIIGSGPSCFHTLECVREIQNGHLREEVRNFGTSDLSSSDTWDYSEINPTNPAAINTIVTDVKVQGFSGIQCPTSSSGWTHGSVEIGGDYFNTGTGDPNDDVSDLVALTVDTNDPKTITVSNWLSGSNLGVGTQMATYPIGTPLTVMIAWDKANHQFISAVKVKGDKSVVRVNVPYNVSDNSPAVQLRRWLATGADSANCATETFAAVEAFYDNVMFNVVPTN